jgi:hypothetical protein
MEERVMADFSERQPFDVFKSQLVKGASFSPNFEFPLLEPTYFRPVAGIPFEKAASTKNHSQWVHFFTHDFRFERVWSKPQLYLPILQRFEGVISPDFSLFRAMPLAMQIWNTFRNRALAYWFQSQGLNVVPNVRWGDQRTYGFVFEGLPQGASVAVSTHGCIRESLDRRYFQAGLARLVDELQPSTIINHGRTPDDIFGWYKKAGIDIVEMPCYAQVVRQRSL